MIANRVSKGQRELGGKVLYTRYESAANQARRRPNYPIFLPSQGTGAAVPNLALRPQLGDCHFAAGAVVRGFGDLWYID
jgi:hypothetical protein